MKRAIVIAAAALLVGGCAGMGGPSFEEVVAQAEKEIKVAKSMKYLWRDTEKFLKKAKAAKKKGDDEKAMKLAKKALFQAKQAQIQAKENMNAGPVYN